MINDGLRSVSISFNYSVPYIAIDGSYYSIKTKNFSDEVKKKRPAKKEDDEKESVEDDDNRSVVATGVALAASTVKPDNKIVTPIEQATQALNVTAKALKENKINAEEAFNKVTETVKAVTKAVVPVPAPVDVAAETINAVTDAVKAVTQSIKIKRKKPVVAPTQEENLAVTLGEDADLQAAIAASLGK
jgi:hypothetical protein